MLRLASASTPGSKRRDPSLSAASRSMVPTTRSSEALIGSSTTRMRRVATGSAPPAARSRQSTHQSSGSSGWHPKWQPSTTCCSGSSRASARTAVDFPVPFSPRLSTPLWHSRGVALPSAVTVICAEQRLTTGRSEAGARACAGTETSPPTALDAMGLAEGLGDGDAEGVADAAGDDEHAASRNAATSRVWSLAAPAKLPFHRRRDLIPGKVIEPVIMRAHALCEVRASVDCVRLVHRGNPRQVLHRRQVAVVASGVDDERVDVLRVDQRRDLLRLDERLLLEHRDVAAAVADEDEQGA